MHFRSLLVVLALAGLCFAGDLEVIVGFKGDVDRGLVERHGAAAGDEIDGINAMTARIPAARLAKLRTDPSVAYVEENGYVSISKPGNGKGKNGGGGSETPPPQEWPWGIDRVGGGRADCTGDGIKVGVIDTGIDSDHEDLAANVKGGKDFTGSHKGWEDEHGHGSHCAGTIAAVDNDRGVIGVAPKAHLYGIRVLDRRGWGSWGDVASGITWAANNGMQIASMSLGGGHSSTVENACAYASSQGVLLLAAAGNGGDNNVNTIEISYPAAYSTVGSVGATNSNDGIASFSNTGPHVEFAGPGVGVKSTYKNNGYQTWNGTSMACPHAAGVAALIWEELGSTTAGAVRTALQNRADDLGPVGRDWGYGYGIVHYSKP